MISTENWTGCHSWHNQFLSDTLHTHTQTYIHVEHMGYSKGDALILMSRVGNKNESSQKNNTSFCQEFLPRPQTQYKAHMHLAALNERIGVALTGYSAS